MDAEVDGQTSADSHRPTLEEKEEQKSTTVEVGAVINPNSLSECEENPERSQNVQMTRTIVEKDMKIPEHLTTPPKESRKDIVIEKYNVNGFGLEAVVVDQEEVVKARQLDTPKMCLDTSNEINNIDPQLQVMGVKTTVTVDREPVQREIMSQTPRSDTMVDSSAQTVCCVESQEQRDQLTQGQDIRAADEPLICVTVSGENVPETMTLQGPVAVILQKLQTMLSNQNPEDTVVKQLVTESTVDLNTKSPAEDDDNLMSPAEEEEQMDGDEEENAKLDTDETTHEEHEVLLNAQDVILVEVVTTKIKNQPNVMTKDVVKEIINKDNVKKMISCWTGREGCKAFNKYQEYFINSSVRERKGIG